MNSIEGEIQEKRLALVPLDEFNRFAAEGVGEIFLFIDLLRAAKNALIVEIIVRAAEEAKKFVEAALVWMKLRLRAEVPFADESRGVAGRFEPRGDRRFGHGQAAARRTGVELVAEP